MAQAWPAVLVDKLNVQGFQRLLGSTTVESEVEIGLPKVRRRFTKPINRIQAQFQIERTDVDTFEDFYNTTLNGGVTTFEFTDPISNTLKEYRFDTNSPPSYTPIGANHFNVSMIWIEIP